MLRTKNYPKAVGLRVTKETYRDVRAVRRRDEAISDTFRRLIRLGLDAQKTAENVLKTKESTL